MKKSLFLLILFALTLSGCLLPYYTTGVDFVRNIKKEKSKKRYFSSNDIVYISELSPSSIFFVSKGQILNVNNEKDIKIYKKMIDFWNLEEKDEYGYNTPSEFLSTEYNVNISSKFNIDPIINSHSHTSLTKMKVFSLDEFNKNLFKMSKKKTNKEPVDLPVIEPKDIDSFCTQFTQKYPDATHVIIANTMIISSEPLTYSITVGWRAIHLCTILVTKSIIDLKKKKISGYDLNQTPIFRGGFLSVRESLKNGFGLEGTRLRKYF